MDLRTRLLLTAVLTSSAALAAPEHRAEPVPVEFSHSRQAFEPWSFDTGWMPRPNPKGGTGLPPIQVRFAGFLGGGMRASAQGEVELGWSPWQHWGTGTPDGGELSMDLGVELQTYLRLTLTLPDGSPFQWEGELPGVKGFDYRFAADGTFTPFLMPGGVGSPEVLVSDAIQKTQLFSIPLTPTLIPIPEVNGTLDVYAGGVLDLLLKNGRLVFPQGSVIREDAPLEFSPVPGAMFGTEVGYQATAVYSSILELEPTVTLHIGPLDWSLAAFPIPVPLTPIEELWDFNGGEPTPIEFALPRAELFDVDGAALLISGGELEFGTGPDGEEVSRTVRLTNVGLAPLSASFSVSGAGFTVDSVEALTLDPYGIAERVITLRRGATAASGVLAVQSSDPSGPSSFRLTEKQEVVEVDGGSGNPTDGGTGGPADGGSAGGLHEPFDERPMGCASAGGSAAVFPIGLALLLGVLLRRRGGN